MPHKVLHRFLVHNTTFMPPRLILAFALSLALHGSLLLPGLLKRLPVAPPRPALQAILRLPPVPQPAPLPTEPLLKDTIAAETPEETTPLEKPAPTPAKPSNKDTLKRDVQIARKKLSKTQFYPPEAIAQNIEGDVRLIIKIADDGKIDNVSIASSSGHAILDNAAIKTAYAMGALPGVSSRELILPVIFRLE
jgi:protein TonB